MRDGEDAAGCSLCHVCVSVASLSECIRGV